MVIGYDSTQFGDITSIDDLLDPKFAGVVALNGNPTEAGAAFNGVMMASLAKGGSLDDISPGVTFFKAVKDAGNLYTGNPTPATVASGETPVLFDWSYNQIAYKTGLEKEGVDWKLFVPEGANIGSYYNQAINKDAPHPAAARLWEEFLYSAEAQNLWLKGGANPVLQEKMVADGTINQEYLDVLGSSAAPAVQTADQVTKAQDYLKANWSHGHRLIDLPAPTTADTMTAASPTTPAPAAPSGAGAAGRRCDCCCRRCRSSPTSRCSWCCRPRSW